MDCPLCVEPLGLDEQILPCPCGYQVCMFCWHRVKEEGSGLCPACRVPYADAFALAKVSPPPVKVSSKVESGPIPKKYNGHPRFNLTKSASSPHLSGPSPSSSISNSHHQHYHQHGSSRGRGGGAPRISGAGAPSSTTTHNLKDSLQGVSVFQRNLVVLRGLPSSLTSEATLRRQELCGQFCVNSQPKVIICSSQSVLSGFSSEIKEEGNIALVWFSDESEARACVIAVDGFRIGESVIRCNIGALEYCESFLKNEPPCGGIGVSCNKLHSMGPRSDSFTSAEKDCGFNEYGSSYAELKHPNLHFTNANGVIGDSEPRNPILLDKASSKGDTKLAFPSVPPHLIGYARGTVPLPRGLSLQRPETSFSGADSINASGSTKTSSSHIQKQQQETSRVQKHQQEPPPSSSIGTKPFLAAAMRHAQPLKPLPVPKKQHGDSTKHEPIQQQQQQKSHLISATEAAAALSAALASGAGLPQEAIILPTEPTLDNPRDAIGIARQPLSQFQRSRRGKRGSGKSKRATATAAVGEEDNSSPANSTGNDLHISNKQVS
jgi:hypothetical protein